MILADEPTSGLDLQMEREIMALLREIHQTGVTFMMVTHNLELIPYAARAIKMEDTSLHPIAKT